VGASFEATWEAATISASANGAVGRRLQASSPRSTGSDDDHDRVLHRLKLRAAGRQSGGRDSRCVSCRHDRVGSVGRRPFRGEERRARGIRKVQARTPRVTRWSGPSAPSV